MQRKCVKILSDTKGIHQKSIALFLLFLTILFSILAQVLDISILKISRPAMYLSWLILGIFLLFRSQFTVKVYFYGLHFLYSYIFFLLFCLTTTLFGLDHLHAGILLPLTISFGAYFVGLMLRQIGFEEELFKRCLIIFAFSVCLLAIEIKSTYFSSLSSWMTDTTYGYTKKNSAGQLFAVASIVLVFYLNYTSKLFTAIRFLLTGFLIYTLLLVQCRTALIAFIFTCLSKVVFVKKNRFKTLFFYLIIGAVALTNQQVLSIVRKALFLDKYTGTDLNTFSSGRLGLFTEALQVFYSHPILGNGSYYVDDFYLNLLAESGIIGFVIIVTLFIVRIILNFKLKINMDTPKNNLNALLKLLSVFYIAESFLEAYPPLGPGVCSFVFWLLNGYNDVTKLNESAGNISKKLIRKPIKKRQRITW